MKRMLKLKPKKTAFVQETYEPVVTKTKGKETIAKAKKLRSDRDKGVK